MIIDVRRPLPPDYPMPQGSASSNELDKGKPGGWLVFWAVVAVIGWAAFIWQAVTAP